VPVYVYTSGDQVELFLNGASLGRKKLQPFTYKLQWDNVTYAPGELKAVAYKDGNQWAETSVQTTGEPAAIQLEADRDTIRSDGKDLSFITTRIVDSNGLTVPTAQNRIKYEIVGGPGQIVATDNGDATDLETFSHPERQAFNGLALTIIRGHDGQTGEIRIRAMSDGLSSAEVTIHLN
jgi:beta-galactosidase